MSNLPPTVHGYQLWYYYTSVPGNVIVALLFLALCIFHIVFIRRDSAKFCISLLIGGIFEFAGYIIRAYCHSHPQSITFYSIQSVLILVAPVLMAATAYMFLGRIISRINGERYSLISRKWLTKIFVTSDIVCFLIQGAGASLLARSDSESQTNTYQKIILAGLALQIIFFGFFITIAVVFHHRMKRWVSSIESGIHWQELLISLYAVSFLIILRNIVRAVEFGEGKAGYLLTHEWATFVFDAACMLLVMIISMSWYHLRPSFVPAHTRDLERSGVISFELK
ncbi:RTA1 like protein-domain-containing protein [Lipomyces oligophaga]|uniref:RTA1 like protein-domain-containing protein n=1 Tax=Lipomyces oligophaga TaxID=45792 RepID=UPI0034CDCE0D